ncbi:uncharacterized protein LOC112690539 [Sipha flava]|uniref:Uncharacterized protein LOC112690539 n=1 Tax=Sipha flava TaxID=143950 RepID=A0A8B8GBR0_9HEMI|nr:uncharacterized protein LOC112690539 [Sipha flava]
MSDSKKSTLFGRITRTTHAAHRLPFRFRVPPVSTFPESTFEIGNRYCNRLIEINRCWLDAPHTPCITVTVLQTFHQDSEKPYQHNSTTLTVAEQLTDCRLHFVFVVVHILASKCNIRVPTGHVR